MDAAFDSSEAASVSAVIPAYNAAETIGRALDSVYAQTWENIIEVIVVDDGSKDNTVEVVREKCPDVKLLRQENAGASAARNAGIEAASGEMIAFLDADDEWLPEKTEVQIGLMQRHPGLVLVTSAAREAGRGSPSVEENADSSCSAAIAPLTFHGLLHSALPPGVLWSCSGWLGQAAVMREYGFDTSMSVADDREFLLRLTGRGHSVAVVRRPLYRYHVLVNSLSHSKKNRLLSCRKIIEIISRYDPEGDGWESELLTAGEFRRALHARYAARAWHLLRLGQPDEAQEYLRQAVALSDARGLQRLRERFAAWNPRLYHALSRLRTGS